MFVGTLTDSKDAWPILIYTAILLLIVWFMKPIVRAWWMVRNIPGPPTIPIIGNFHNILFLSSEEIHAKFVEWYKTYGPLVRIQYFSNNVVIINNPEDAKLIMMNPKVKNRGPIYEFVTDMFIKDSLFFLKDDEWSARRKLINNAFQFKNVVTYLDTFAELAEELCDRLVNVADGRTIVDIRDELYICTMTGVMETAIGVNHLVENKKDHVIKLKDTFKVLMTLVTARACNPLVWPQWIYDLTSNGKVANKEMKWMHELVDHHIALAYKNVGKSDGKENKITAPGEKKIMSFCEIVIEESIKEGKTIPASHVRSDVLLLGAASHSCANVMAFLLLLIGIHPEYQERLFEEQRAVFGDSLRPVKYEDFTKMPLLEIVIKETLRVLPIFTVSPLHLSCDVPISNGHVLPSNTYVTINHFNIHHDPQNYVDHEKFWPERWLPENSVGRHPCSYVPFGVGIRNCIAIKYAQFQMKATISRMLRQFRFTNDYTMDHMMKIGFSPIGLTLNGYDVRITKRTTTDLK